MPTDPSPANRLPPKSEREEADQYAQGKRKSWEQQEKEAQEADARRQRWDAAWATFATAVAEWVKSPGTGTKRAFARALRELANETTVQGGKENIRRARDLHRRIYDKDKTGNDKAFHRAGAYEIFYLCSLLCHAADRMAMKRLCELITHKMADLELVSWLPSVRFAILNARSMSDPTKGEIMSKAKPAQKLPTLGDLLDLLRDRSAASQRASEGFERLPSMPSLDIRTPGGHTALVAVEDNRLAAMAVQRICALQGVDRIKTFVLARGKQFDADAVQACCAAAAENNGKTLGEIMGWDLPAVADLLQTPPAATLDKDEAKGGGDVTAPPKQERSEGTGGKADGRQTRKRSRKGVGGKPRLTKAEEKKRLDVLQEWWKAQGAGVKQKKFCREKSIEVKTLRTFVNWYGTRKSRTTNSG